VLGCWVVCNSMALLSLWQFSRHPVLLHLFASMRGCGKVCSVVQDAIGRIVGSEAHVAIKGQRVCGMVVAE